MTARSSCRWTIATERESLQRRSPATRANPSASIWFPVGASSNCQSRCNDRIEAPSGFRPAWRTAPTVPRRRNGCVVCLVPACCLRQWCRHWWPAYRDWRQALPCALPRRPQAPMGRLSGSLIRAYPSDPDSCWLSFRFREGSGWCLPGSLANCYRKADKFACRSHWPAPENTVGLCLLFPYRFSCARMHFPNPNLLSSLWRRTEVGWCRSLPRSTPGQGLESDKPVPPERPRDCPGGRAEGWTGTDCAGHPGKTRPSPSPKRPLVGVCRYFWRETVRTRRRATDRDWRQHWCRQTRHCRAVRRQGWGLRTSCTRNSCRPGQVQAGSGGRDPQRHRTRRSPARSHRSNCPDRTRGMLRSCYGKRTAPNHFRRHCAYQQAGWHCAWSRRM